MAISRVCAAAFETKNVNLETLKELHNLLTYLSSGILNDQHLGMIQQ